LISATFDTNIYIRGLHFGGAGAALLAAAKAGSFRLDLSEAILSEAARVLREKFAWDGYSINDAYRKIRAIGNPVIPTETLSVIQEDPDDDRILECAAEAKSDYIVSEDKDLLRTGEFRGTKM
jgi:uncharacterized protein